MLKYEKYAGQLVKKMTVREKLAQLSQTVAGYRCYERRGDEFFFVDSFKKFISDYGAMGAISNILRACSWTKKDWGIGIEPAQRVKVANMLQKYAIEHSRLQIPVIIEVEANHGLQALGSEMFPTNIGMGCAFNSELYGEIMDSVGRETYLSGNHMAFVTMFDLARDPRWGRTEEFFSEDPYLASEYARAGVEGLKRNNVLACCKHYCATGDGFGGLNTAEVSIGRRELHDIYLPVVEKAVKAGADVIMAAYNTVDGIPCHVNKYLLRSVLRDELGFDGIVLSDGWGVKRTISQMNRDEISGSAMALEAGIDLSLADDGAYLKLEDALNAGIIEQELIDAAVTRIIAKKYQLGLFDNPFLEDNGALSSYFDSGIQKRLSYKAAAESAVLLKNNGVLPIKSSCKIALFGAHADNLYYLLGDYASLRKKGEGKTLKEAMQESFESVAFSKGWDFRGIDNDFSEALKIAEESDVIVVTLGGSTAKGVTEVQYDKNTGAAISSKGFIDCGEGNDVADIKLPGNQNEFLECIKKAGKPVIAVLIAGRPYEITHAEELADGLLAAWYPGQQGADAITDILLGKINPSGKLSVSIPYASACLPAYYNRIGDDAANPLNVCSSNTYVDHPQRILHPFGYGLSYSQFKYKNIDAKQIGKNDFRIFVTLENVSDIAGKEAVQLYIRGFGGSVRRRGKELKGFKKVYLEPHETKTVEFKLGFDELKIYSASEKYEVEAGKVKLMAGSNPDLPLEMFIETQAESEHVMLTEY